MRTKTRKFILIFTIFFSFLKILYLVELVSNYQRFQIVHVQPNGLDNPFFKHILFKSHETMAAIIGEIVVFLQSKNLIVLVLCLFLIL